VRDASTIEQVAVLQCQVVLVLLIILLAATVPGVGVISFSRRWFTVTCGPGWTNNAIYGTAVTELSRYPCAELRQQHSV
jgi:hypothetical protein